ncbi:MAG TPA: SIR2 family protein [Xanthomonadales bacterium]|nr:SIR2 family protein [Xanthomonadales bacterium]
MAGDHEMARVRRKLIEDLGAELRRGSAAVFLGAGLSLAAGYPTWQELLEDAARALRLDIKEDADLVEVAQFIINEHGDRSVITQLIKDRFAPRGDVPEPLKLLAQLPIANIWTTNYDTLIERAYAEVGRQAPEVKKLHSHLTLQNYSAQTVIYKMHGSFDVSESCVIAKDDFESYARDRAGFLNLLAADYIAKRFLFLGLSFKDPNLNYVLATIRSVFRSGSARHYAVMQYPQSAEYKKKSRYEHDFNRFKHWIRDMKTRYGINVYAIDDFEDIERLLSDLTIEFKGASTRHSVYVNGSFAPGRSGRPKMERLCRRIGKVLAQRDKRFVSGLGPVVGPSTLRGFVETLDNEGKFMQGRLLLGSIAAKHPDAIRRRRDLMTECGVWILIGGKKGTREDVEVARTLAGLLIPIPGTGGTAEEEAEKILDGPKNAPGYHVLVALKKANFSVKHDADHDIERVAAVLERHLSGGS